jgi:hypothetical protein
MAQEETALQPTAYVAGADAAGAHCSICQTNVIAGESMVNCPHCSLPFHDECWRENRGCSSYGCKAAPPTVKPDRPVQQMSNVWGGEKKCPSCRKTIKAQALKCRFCGASFDTRDAITRDAYASREYEGQEYLAARNKVIGLFLLSAAACLSPIALVLTGVIIFGGKGAGIEFRRLPSALRAVLRCAFGVSILLLIIMAGIMVVDS